MDTGDALQPWRKMVPMALAMVVPKRVELGPELIISHSREHRLPEELDLFSHLPGCTNLIEHNILGGCTPIVYLTDSQFC